MSFIKEAAMSQAKAVEERVSVMTTKDQLQVRALLAVTAAIVYVGDQIAESNKSRASLPKKV